VKGHLDRLRDIVRPTILFIDIDLAKEEAKCVQQSGLARPVRSYQRNQAVTSEVDFLQAPEVTDRALANHWISDLRRAVVVNPTFRSAI
jgi:hypothetical protein